MDSSAATDYERFPALKALSEEKRQTLEKVRSKPLCLLRAPSPPRLSPSPPPLSFARKSLKPSPIRLNEIGARVRCYCGI